MCTWYTGVYYKSAHSMHSGRFMGIIWDTILVYGQVWWYDMNFNADLDNIYALSITIMH